MEQAEKIGSIWTWHIVTLSRLKYNLKILNAMPKKELSPNASGR